MRIVPHLSVVTSSFGRSGSIVFAEFLDDSIQISVNSDGTRKNVFHASFGFVAIIGRLQLSVLWRTSVVHKIVSVDFLHEAVLSTVMRILMLLLKAIQ